MPRRRLFNKSPLQLRLIGARGGRAFGRNQRLRRALLPTAPPDAVPRRADAERYFRCSGLSFEGSICVAFQSSVMSGSTVLERSLCMTSPFGWFVFHSPANWVVSRLLMEPARALESI